MVLERNSDGWPNELNCLRAWIPRVPICCCSMMRTASPLVSGSIVVLFNNPDNKIGGWEVEFIDLFEV